MIKQPTAKQWRFVELLLANKFNIKMTAKLSGYTYDSARQLLTKTHIQAAISQLQAEYSEKTGVTIERVLKEYARLAFVDPKAFYDDDGNVKPIHELDESLTRCITGIEHSTEYETVGGKKVAMGRTIKIHTVNKKGALDSLAKYLGMFINKENNDNDRTARELTRAELIAIASGKNSSGQGGGRTKSHSIH